MGRRLEEILLEVEKPSRYLGGEHNSIAKDHAKTRARAVLAFPDVYEIGMSHLGLRILYDVINRREGMLLERCFAPWPDMEMALRDNGIPLHSLETRTPLAEFDLVGFSLQYELSFTNVLMMLDLAGIPFRSAERGEESPLVVGGGPAAFSPEPVADFFDAFLIGDGEEAFPLLLETYVALRERRRERHGGAWRGGPAAREARREILKALARLPGVYVPSLYRTARDPLCGLHYVAGPDPSLLAEGEEPPPFPIRRAVVDDINEHPFPAATVVPHSDIVHDRVSIEIARGCTEGCRFCQAGFIYRPVRERTAASIVETSLEALARTGYDEMSLTSLSPADYSCLPDLVERVMDTMADSRVGVSVSSLRPYGLTEHLARQIGRVKKSGFTIAPEAGTQRMRDALNKGITEEQILEAARNAFGAGWDLIKLYFMIGLPGETEEDLQGMIDLTEEILRIGRERLSKRAGGPGGSPRIHFSASSHVPKPHAPFQWARMEPIETLEDRQRFLAARLRNRGVRFKRHHVETSILEAVMSRGDRRLAGVIEAAYRKGCRFDGWTELFRWSAWREALAENGLGIEEFLAEIPVEASLPWDHVDTMVAKPFLEREWRRAREALATPACEKPHEKFSRPFRRDDRIVCYDCGCACDLPKILDERIANRDGLLSIRPGRAPRAAAPADAPAIRYRAVFRKGGRSRFLSHLDLNRAFARAFRRAGIRLKYSQGFNPKPLLAFSPALALGAEGLREGVDFALGAPIPAGEIAARLNAALPEGVRILSVSLTGTRDPLLSADVRAAAYRVAVPERIEPARSVPGRRSGAAEAMPFGEESGLRGEEETRNGGQADEAEIAAAPAAAASSPGGDPSWHREKVAAFNRAASIVFQKARKGRAVSVDLKEFVREVSFEERNEPGSVNLLFRVAFRQGATVRPEEVLIGIYGFAPRGASIVREGLEYAPSSPRGGAESDAAPGRTREDEHRGEMPDGRL